MGKVIFLIFCHILCVSTHRVSRSVAESDSVNRDDNDGTCLLESTPKLDSLYCKTVLQSFESNLNQVLQKIEEKIEHFDVEKGCRKGWHKYGMHCYYFSKDKMSWHQARDYCQLEGSADLLSVRDDAEHEYILDKLKNLVPDEDGAIHLWIGLHDLHREGMYQWSDNMPLTTAFWKNGMEDFEYVLQSSSNVTVFQPIPDMHTITTCFWMKTGSNNKGTPVSYAAYSGFVNEFVVYDYSDIQLIVLDENAKSGVGNISANDEKWHHICATWDSENGDWQIVKDGKVAKQGTGLKMGLYIRGGGVLILGQDQDTVGGTFDPNQAFIGELSQFNIWDRILSINQIISNMADCSGTGNVYSWHTNNIISSETFTIELLKEICGQPNNFQGLQDCVEMMDIYGNWNDANCLNKQRFVCKTYIVPRDCSDARSHGFTQSGIYTIDPDGKGSFDVYCDMDTDDGGYTIIQRRFDMSIDFNRDWNEYKLGFGDLNSEFWLGNEKLNRLTGQRRQELRVDLVNVQGEAAFIVYDYFSIAHENDKYRLRVGHKTNGDLGDKLDYHRNMQFTTRDSDNDMSSASNCAVSYYSGWWYNTCHHAELNVEYSQYDSLQWDDWETPSISGSMMKIRKADHEPPVVYW